MHKFEKIFKERNLLCLVDAIARRYGKTPYEVLTQMSIFEFNLNMAIMAVANLEENKPQGVKEQDWNRWGIKRTVIRKGKS